MLALNRSAVLAFTSLNRYSSCRSPSVPGRIFLTSHSSMVIPISFRWGQFPTIAVILDGDSAVSNGSIGYLLLFRCSGWLTDTSYEGGCRAGRPAGLVQQGCKSIPHPEGRPCPTA